VAVATGEGVQRIFRSLGVDRIVAGGQSMNPSTSQILDAVEQASAPEVVVLPNNDNISAVASQAADLSPKRVEVVPTRGIAEGLAALMEYDPFAPAADNARARAAASGRVVAGEVTRAQRSSRCWLGPIAEGDWIALSPRGIEAVDKELVGAVCSLLERLVGEGHELVTLIEGEGASRADTRRVTEWLSENRPGVEAEVHYGGQPLYAYLVSVE
jgi:dihydroxyacetone kinase-like predicted kinase